VHSDRQPPVLPVYRCPAVGDAGKRRRGGQIRESHLRTSPPPVPRRSTFPLISGLEHISPALVFPGLHQADQFCSWSTPTRRTANCAGPLCRSIAACDLGGRGAEEGLPTEPAVPSKLCTTFSRFRAPKGLPVELETGAD